MSESLKRTVDEAIPQPDQQEEPVAKKARLDDADSTATPRFRNVIFELNEDYDSSGFYVIEGDAPGREAFEALVLEARALAEKTDTPCACFLSLLLGGIEPYGGGKRAAVLNQRLQELVVEHNITASSSPLLRRLDQTTAFTVSGFTDFIFQSSRSATWVTE
jgi:hypothetical protein